MNELDPDIKIQESVWSWPEASPGQRASAFVLDTLIIGALTGLLQVLASRVLGVELPSSFKYLLATAYFILTQSKTGQTPGKKIVGIRVVPLSPMEVETGVPLPRLILRETVGRWLSGTLLFYGYIRILTRSDRMALHDALSRTRVINLNEIPEGGMSPGFSIRPRHVVLAVVGLGAVVGGGFYVVANFTSFPLRTIANQMERSMPGLHVGRIDGNLAKGFTIASIERKTDDFEFEIHGVHFSYDSKKDAENGSEFVIHDLSVESAKIKVARWPESKPKTKSASNDPGPFGADPKRASLTMMAGLIRVESIDIGDVDLSVPNRAPYHVSRISITDIDWKMAVKTATIGRIYIDSEPLLADVREVIAQEKTIHVGKPAYVQLRPSLFPEYLKSTVDLQIDGLIEDWKLTKLNLTGFAGRLQLHKDGDSGELRIAGLTPLHYLKTDLPLWNIDVRAVGDIRKFDMRQMTGSVGVRGARFELGGTGLIRQMGAKRFQLSPRLPADWLALLSGKVPGFVLGSSDRKNAREILSELYFAKTGAQLLPAERSIVDQDRRYFSDSADAGAPPVLAPIAVAAPIARKPQPVLRLPTSAGSHGPLRLPPRILPPYKGHH